MSRLLAEAVAYGVFIVFIGALSVWPEYRLLADSEAIVSLTFNHAGMRKEECRRLTQEELNSLPPNMRKPDECPRERHPVRVELRIDERLVHADTAPPSGLWNDGKSSIYRRVTVDAGEHEIFIGMTDSGMVENFDYEFRRTMTIESGRNLVISFDGLTGSFIIE